MCATLFYHRWNVSGNLNCQRWPKLSDVLTRETVFAAFCIDGLILYPKKCVTSSLLSSLKLHRQQQFRNQTEFDYRKLLAPLIRQRSSCWSEHTLSRSGRRANSKLSQSALQVQKRKEKKILYWLISKWLTFTSSLATWYQIRLQFGSTTKDSSNHGL